MEKFAELFRFSGEKRMNSTIYLPKPVYFAAHASVVGKHEKDGPLGGDFDLTDKTGTDKFGAETWESSEGEMQRLALSEAMKKASLTDADISMIFAGDLQNQCVGSAYGLLGFDVPFCGLYGACSTSAEGLILASLISSAYGITTAAVASSHNCVAERQFRYPVEYGGQRSPTSQWTVTGAGAFILSPDEKYASAPHITEVLPGRSFDRGINDLNNMGAAMAPAAVDTLCRYFNETGTSPDDFDLIVTGDLGAEGSRILCEFMSAAGFDIRSRHCDCGLLIYDREGTDKHAGGSGCGCSASVLSASVLPRLGKDLHNILFTATGAMMSPASVQQGNSIPAICHLLRICTPERNKNGQNN